MTLTFEQLDLTLPGLKAHYARGDFSPRELTVFLRARAQQFADRNIWIHALSDTELEPYLAALDERAPTDLPLYGVPFAIKDNIDLAQIPTTAACSAYSYTPSQHAFVVDLLIRAGAIPLGKTNLDQFATGLVGTRSPQPWGECGNSFDADYISGGSSSGSAVAVALGLASFSLGTDTAGSGRIPAAFNNLCGLKPTRGVLSTRGVVPACRSLDCVSLFALTAADLDALFAIAAQFDGSDDYARPNPAHNTGAAFGALPSAPFRFGVPRADQLQFFSDADYASAFKTAIEQLTALGGVPCEIDFSPFLDAARLLYEGPWVAERHLVIESLLQSQPEAILPVIRDIVAPGGDKSAPATFAALYKLQHCRRAAESALRDVAFIVTPTAGTHWTRAEVADAPIARNSDLGYYTNFMNLLDLSAVAVPSTLLASGLPFGITLVADRFSDLRLLSYADALQRATALPLGACDKTVSLPARAPRQEQAFIDVVVCGAHMQGLPLNGQLRVRRAEFVRSDRSSPHYKLFALAGGPPYRPGMVRDDSGVGIEVEVWRVPVEEFGSFVAQIPAPLGIGKVELADGRWYCGFVCEGYAVATATDITEFGGWRAYLKSKAS